MSAPGSAVGSHMLGESIKKEVNAALSIAHHKDRRELMLSTYSPITYTLEWQVRFTITIGDGRG